jgi:hypothetical protein
MSHTSRPPVTVAITDQLRAAGLVLAALEAGRVPMDAGDYLDMAAAAAQELSSLETSELRLTSQLPPALMALAENVLFDRTCRYRWGPRSNPSLRAWPAVLEKLCRPTYPS